MDTKDGLKQLMREFAVEPDSDAGLKLLAYLALLEKWNSRVNLTAQTTWTALEPLFREGIWAAGLYPKEFRTHLDIGSGAGFPAIILRVFQEDMNLELVESRAKKGAFLETTAYELGLAKTSAIVKRLSDVLEECAPEKTWDCVSWKAIRLEKRDLAGLSEHMTENSRFWMFHGAKTAYPGLQREVMLPVPGRNESFLSICKPLI